MPTALVLPSKRVIVIGGACLVAVGAVVAASFYKPNTDPAPGKTLSSVSVSDKTEPEVSNVDSDSDGLKDWEETLWGTDPKKADTDGDSVSDGDEVKSGKNPLVKGPHDTLTSKNEPVSQSTINPQNKNLSDTDKFARELFSSYMALKQSGQEITPEIQNQLVQNLLLKTEAAIPGGKVYTYDDLRINSDDTNDALRAYGNAMGALLLKDAPNPEKGGELYILQQAVETQDPKVLAKLDIIVEAYKKLLRDMLVVRVPASAVPIHLSIVNELSSIITNVQGLKVVFNDPVRTMTALQQFQKNADEVFATFESVKKYFASRDITYAPNEPGYRFTHSNT